MIVKPEIRPKPTTKKNYFNFSIFNSQLTEAGFLKQGITELSICGSLEVNHFPTKNTLGEIRAARDASPSGDYLGIGSNLSYIPRVLKYFQIA